MVVMSMDEGKTPTKIPTPFSPHLGFAGWPSFDQLRRQMDSLFHDLPARRHLGETEPFERFFTSFAAAPAVDVVEKDTEYRITAELPGMDEKDVEVKLAGDVLTISGEKKDEHEEKEKHFSFSERRYGAFKRTFQLPEGVDCEKIAASFEKGVLTVTLPKTAAAKSAEKKIEVTSK